MYIFKVQVGKDREKAQSEKDYHSKNRGREKTKLITEISSFAQSVL